MVVRAASRKSTSLFLFFSTVAFAFTVHEQPAAQPVGEIELGDSCSYFGESLPDTIFTFSSDSEAEDAIEAIVEAIGLIPKFETQAAGVPNAAALIQGRQRYILYNQYFMRSVRDMTENHWAPISILAHEIGHHLNAHTLDQSGSRPEFELEADYFSGNVLQRMGATLEDATAAMRQLGSPTGSSTHPAREDRIAAITNGWVKACERDPECGNSPPEDIPEPGVSERPEPNSCRYAHDDECDEPDLCDPGTDTDDCRNQRSDPGVSRRPGPNSCRYAHDDVCDEPDICDPGTDTDDCRNQRPIPGSGPGPGPGMVAYMCYTQYGACQLVQPLPSGSFCYCVTVYGNIGGYAQ